MRELYPAIHPYVTHSIRVDEVHTLHVEESGNPQGLPVVFLHGGPGAGCTPWHRQFFDPQTYRIILFDQRGCGRSAPHAELANNTTQDLVDDMERIRERLGIERWVVFGGSWGSTLGLVYAQTHPQRARGLILRGIFLCRPRDVRWFYHDGASRLFPDYWEEFVEPIERGGRGDLLGAYYRRLSGGDEVRRMAAAKAWSLWEGRCATLRPNPRVVGHFEDPFTALSLARIESHYFVHDCFLAPDQILRDVSRLRSIPGIVVHGRYDMICPLYQAWELHRAWPEAELRIIDDAGHGATEPGIVDALVGATRAMAERLA
ncbi:MAG: prolyl aminopeptidase [Gammaproteobacteria bacterium]|nr:prolyl aminopeptidase [Gammaproteobacteria bacterium]NIR97158.1 prolyl aminopeptidase [Gammaproteobacteria bacterium]NIT62856.1 prolyl aminopeptidase [Gammaproteobacteria bacterium]NIV19820.1 prolyl aminopeptidase [Gammaproteobacteria bacterium]NIX11353.1 prolyl aminopeptidase [Gammaproteobacteria bacterium]